MQCFYPGCDKPIFLGDCIEIAKINGATKQVMGVYHVKCYNLITQYVEECQDLEDAFKAAPHSRQQIPFSLT